MGKSTTRPPLPRGKYYILIADDLASHQLMLKVLLEQLGHKVLNVAKDGRELIVMCRAHDPDLVITDVMMPEVSGIEAADQLLTSRGSLVPVIFLTGNLENVPDPKLDPNLAAGRTYLSKPADIDVFRTMIPLFMDGWIRLRNQKKQQEQAEVIDPFLKALCEQSNIQPGPAMHFLQQVAKSSQHRAVTTAQILHRALKHCTMVFPTQPASKAPPKPSPPQK